MFQQHFKDLCIYTISDILGTEQSDVDEDVATLFVA